MHRFLGRVSCFMDDISHIQSHGAVAHDGPDPDHILIYAGDGIATDNLLEANRARGDRRRHYYHSGVIGSMAKGVPAETLTTPATHAVAVAW